MDTLSATIFLTDRCNLACSYCYEPCKEHYDIKKEYIDKFIELLYEHPRYTKKGHLVLDFIGGEPLVVPELIEYSIEKFLEEGRKRSHHWVACSRNSTFFLTTNGTLLGEPRVRELLEKYPRLYCGLSLDGDKESHDLNRKYLNGNGSYDKIMESFDWWRAKYKQPMVKGTVNRETLPRISNMLISLIDLGIEKPWCNLVYEEEWTEEDAKLFQDQIHKVIHYILDSRFALSTSLHGFSKFKPDGNCEHNAYCGTAEYMVAVGLDGKLYPCHRFSTNSAPYKYDIGDLENGIDETKLAKLLAMFKEFRCEGCQANGYCPTCYASFYEINKGKCKPLANYCEIYKVEITTRDYFSAEYAKRCKEEIVGDGGVLRDYLRI